VLPHQRFDVDASVAQGAAVLVRFGDLSGKGDDTFETLYEAVWYAIWNR
jgi:hypothetical protein